MADFINTIDVLGDSAVIDSIIDRSITEFKDDQLMTIGENSFNQCTALEIVDLPNVTTIGNAAFANCTSLLELMLPNVTSVGQHVIQNSGVTKVCLPSVQALLVNALRNASSLKWVDLPSCTSMGQYVFAYDTAMETLILRSETMCTTTAEMFYIATTNPICKGTGYIYVPRALVDSYKVAANWSTFANQFRALEDYTVDGTIYGDLDESKI